MSPVLTPLVPTASPARQVLAKNGSWDSIMKMSGAREHDSENEARENIFKRRKVDVSGAL